MEKFSSLFSFLFVKENVIIFFFKDFQYKGESKSLALEKKKHFAMNIINHQQQKKLFKGHTFNKWPMWS